MKSLKIYRRQINSGMIKSQRNCIRAEETYSVKKKKRNCVLNISRVYILYSMTFVALLMPDFPQYIIVNFIDFMS